MQTKIYARQHCVVRPVKTNEKTVFTAAVVLKNTLQRHSLC
jgi:hypothetical protein